MTPEQLRAWAEYLTGRGSAWSLPEDMPRPSNVFRANASLIERHAELEKIAEGMAVLHEKTTFGKLECVVAYRAWKEKQ